jgi:formate hydrogenlyase subunit 4
MTTWIVSIVQTVLILALAPLAIGLIRKFKARFQNRRGASVWLPYYFLLALTKKKMTITEHSSWVFSGVPFVVLGTALLLAMFIPTLAVGGALGQYGNLILVSSLLMVSAVALVLGGMDVASAFGGMGSSREMTLAALTEPAMIVVFAALGIASGGWTADGAVSGLAAYSWPLVHPFLILVFGAFAFILLIEAARYPVDNPTTHLELTMVHEAMILEYSGPYLAMLEYASAVKFAVLAVFLANLIFPTLVFGAGIGLVWGVVAFAVKFVAVCFGIAFTESVIAKMRFYRMNEFVASAFLLGVIGLILSIVF